MYINTSRSNSEKKNKTTYSIRNLLTYTRSDFSEKVRKIRLKSQIEKNSILSDFHRSIIQRKFENHTKHKLFIETEDNHRNITGSEIFLTKINKSLKNQTTTNYTNKTQSLTERNKSSIDNLKLYSKHYNKKYPIINYKLPFTFNKIIGNYFDKENGRNYIKESLSQFTERVKIKHIYNINHQILLTRYQKIEENNQLKIQEINRKILIMEKAKNYYNNFMENLYQYVRYLDNIIIRERKIMSDLYSYQSDLEFLKLNLLNKIKKTNMLLELYKQYKNFLLLVKYKKTKLTEIPEKELKKFGIFLKTKDSSSSIISRLQSFPKKANSNMSLNNYNTSRKGSLSSRELIKFSSNNIIKKFSKFDSDDSLKNTSMTNIYDCNNTFFNIPIFDSIDEFIYKMNYLEEHVKELFSIFSDVKYNLNSLIIEKNKLKEIGENEEKNKIKIQYNEQLNKELERIKEKNKVLNNKLKNLKNKSNIETKNKVFNKIKNILISLPINIEIDFNIINFYGKINNKKTENIFDDGKYINKSIYGLNILEMILLYYQNYMKNTLKNPKIQYIYDNIIFDLEKKKRIDKNKKIKLKFELNNLDKLCDENKKINKNIVLPIRKIDIYEKLILRKKFEKKEKLKRKKENERNKNGNEYENWIIYS